MASTLSPISRRTLTKGAAWTVPLVSVAAAAPSLAASPNAECPDVAGWQEYGTVVPNFAVDASGVTLTFGLLSPNLNPPADSNVARWVLTEVSATDSNGGPHTGQIVNYTSNPIGLTSPNTLSAKVAFDDFGYSWTDTHRLESYTVTYSIEWLHVDSTTTLVAECDYAADVTATSWDADHQGGTLSSFY